MLRNEEVRAAAAVLASAAGAGFASARGIVLFFSQTGRTLWLGVAFAALLFGCFCAGACHLAHRTGAGSIFSAYMREIGGGLGRIVCGLHGFMMMLAAGFMLGTSGRMAELALPFYNAYWMGVASALCIALLLNLRGGRAMPAAGICVAAACALFMIALWIDPREISFHPNYETALELENSISATLILSATFAAVNAAVAGGTAVRFAGGIRHTARFALCCAAGMLMLLTAANGAIRSGGEKLCSQMLPVVVLAARWGTAGYYLSIAVTFSGAVTTLAAALGALLGGPSEVCRKCVLNYEKRSK